MAKLDDNQIIAMLAEMRDRPQPISPIKSPQKNHSDSEDEIPSSQPASTRPKAKAGLRLASPTDDIQPSQPQSPNVPRRKQASAICATRSRTLSQDTPRQQSPSLFFENTPAREPAQLVCNIGLGHTSDQTKTSKPVFTRSVPELNKTSSNLRSASRTLKRRWPPCFLIKTNANKPNGGSSRLPADPLSEATSPNQLPAISRTQLTNSLYDLKQK